MSSKGTKWVSQRVQQHQQQTGPGPATGASGGGPNRPSGAGGNAGGGVGAKIMEDSAISAQRIKEAQAAGAHASPAAEVPAALSFERQEATDALSNFAHNDDSIPYELRGEPVFKPAHTMEEFNARMLKDLQGLDK